MVWLDTRVERKASLHTRKPHHKHLNLCTKNQRVVSLHFGFCGDVGDAYVTLRNGSSAKHFRFTWSSGQTETLVGGDASIVNWDVSCARQMN